MRIVAVMTACVALGLVAVPGAHASKWRTCGTFKQPPVNGYATTNRVQARDGASCAIARHIALHFRSGGYTYKGLTCFYAPMGSGNPYWNFSCSPGTSGHSEIPHAFVRGHSHTA
jgi:hypothetical protein